MTYRIEPFKKEHLAQMEVGPDTKRMIEFIGGDVFSSNLQTNGPAYSGFADEDIVVIGGVNILWRGVGEAWAMLGTGYQRHGLFIHRRTGEYLKHIIKTFNLQRVQAVVMKNHWAGMEWMNRLGFELEGDLRCYFNGKDYLRYAKIIEVT